VKKKRLQRLCVSLYRAVTAFEHAHLGDPEAIEATVKILATLNGEHCAWRDDCAHLWQLRWVADRVAEKQDK